MSFIIFSDFHFHEFQDFAKPIVHNFYGKETKMTDRLLAQIKTIDKVFELANERKSDILFCGDYYNARNKVTTLVSNVGFKVIYENMKKYPSINLHMIVGNHDQADSSPFPEHSLESFKAIPRVHVLDNFEPVETTHSIIYPVSYSEDIPFLKHKIQEFAEEAKAQTKHTILAAHIGVDGSITGKYSHKLEGAFKLGDLFPDVFDTISLGHYHKRQFLGELDNVFYVGNTIPNSFSDEGQEKGVFYIEGKTKPEFIPIQNKHFITLTEITPDTQDIVDNNYVRFVLPKEQAQEVEIFKETSDNIRVEIQREYKTETRIAIDRNSTEDQMVEAYAKEFYPNALETALGVLHEARSL